MTGNRPPVQRTFDYIVVGGGTAGLALAVRLSERADITVAVIEAGPAAFDDPAINIPGRFGETLGTQYDWKFETVEQPGLGNRKLPCPRGRVLGGTSALNFMAWNRGNRQDYDAWSELGNKGWSWDDVLPYFQKSETFYPPDIAHQEKFCSKYEADAHGTKGPLHTTHIREYGPSHQFWHATLNNLGVMTSPDSLAGSNVGAWNMVCTVDPATQTRSYSANAYYLPVSSRPNLTVLCETTVRNIIIERDDDDGWVAKGVRILKDGEPTAILAWREVILAAGAIQSPQVLELSGVGNRSVLEAAGIPVKIENPNVGENLQDHLMTATIFEISDSLTTPDDIKTDPDLRKAAEMAYQSSQTGPWTILPCSIAYCPLSVLGPPEQLADLETRVMAIAKGTEQQRDNILARQFQQGATLGQVEYLFDLGNWSPYFEGEKGKKYGTMLQMLQYPLSRGSVHLPSGSAGQEPGMPTPVIHPRFYLGPGEIDFAVMKMAQHFANEICATYPLASIIKSRVFPPAVHGKTSPSETDNLYDDFVRNCTVTDWHPVGTCAMGGFEGSKAGVVDERLRVYGVRGLRVADASVMPLQVSAHIQATVYMIAEKAAAMILEDADYVATHPRGKPTERPNRL